MMASATPSIRVISSMMKRSTKSVICAGVCRALENASQMIGSALASTLAMIGSSISSGRSPRTRPTRSRTSAAAASGSRPSLNVTVISLLLS